MLALATPPFVWYLMRASGFVALVLLTMTVILGVLGVTRWQSTRWPRLVTGGLHRNVSLIAVSFLALHVATALVDSWIGLDWFGAVVPFESHYRPLWVGLGVVSAELFASILATSLLRRRVGRRIWRTIHWFAWLLWPLAFAHALGSGTDATRGWGLWLCLACGAAVVLAALARVHTARGARCRPREAESTPDYRARPPAVPVSVACHELTSAGRSQ
jgi:methionine sulfoxide reductase heme-binding subunit